MRIVSGTLTHRSKEMTDMSKLILDRYCQIISKRGKIITSEGVELPQGKIVDVPDYKYLGIL